jgi:hypothetical protein
MNLFNMTFFYVRLARFQWYRRWIGGRWEKHHIDICNAFIWLHMSPERCWPDYRQPYSVGTPVIEDYPVKETP